MATKKETAQEKRERIAAQEVQMQSLQSQIDQILEKLKDAIEYHNRSIDPNWS